jgi:hypothetical protein
MTSAFELKYDVAEFLVGPEKASSIIDDIEMVIQQLYPDEFDKPVRTALSKYLAGQSYFISTGICGTTTYGYGNLDELGYWEFPLPAAVIKNKFDH